MIEIYENILEMKKKDKKPGGTELLEEIEATCRGLVYISETDAELTPVYEKRMDGLTIERFVRREAARDSPIEKRSAEDFFGRLTKERDWHGETEIKTARRFGMLQELLARSLGTVEVFRAGHIRVEIFVLGYDAADNIAGVRTAAVET